MREYKDKSIPVTSEESSLANACVDMGDPASAKNEKAVRKRKRILLILLMFLAISQLILLLSSNSLNDAYQQTSVDEVSLLPDDMKPVQVELMDMKHSIDAINLQPEESVRESASGKAESVEEPAVDKSAAVKEAVESSIDQQIQPAATHEEQAVNADDIVKTATVETRAAEVKADEARIIKARVMETESAEKRHKNTKLILVEPVISSAVPPADIDTKVAISETRSVYIKHDSMGNVLADEAPQWVCVEDTITGLMWEVKTKQGDMRDAANLYSWYVPGRDGLQGEADGGRCKETDCDTNAYVEMMNAKKYCGHDDWQLPTRTQMQTLVERTDDTDEVAINRRYFPQTMPSWYWTASEKDGEGDRAWYVLFRNGFALSDLKERAKHIRLVRSDLN